jgi:uncharacterized protein (TIGR00251 family)
MTEPPPLRFGYWRDGDLFLPVRVQPRARRRGLGPPVGDRVKLLLAAPPVDGRANAEARELLAGLFGVPARDVELVSGETGRDKLFRIRQPARTPPELA